jgi:hypothetical protein
MKHDRAMIPASDSELREFQDIGEYVAQRLASYDKCAATPVMSKMVREGWDRLTENRQIIILTALQRYALDAAIKYGQLMRQAACES